MSKSSQVLLVVVGLVVGGVFALLIRPPSRTTVTWGVIVGPQPDQISVPELPMAGTDQVHWVSSNGTTPLYIEFDQQVFANMTRQSNGRYRVQCSGAVCNSGAVLSTTKDGTYKYWQGMTLASAPATITWADGKIIIKW